MFLFQKLTALFNEPKTPSFKIPTLNEPEVTSSVPGFSVSLEKKTGVLLTAKPKDQSDAEAQPASENFYYEVAVRPTGENPEYPGEEASIYRYTVGTDEIASGWTSGVSYIPAGSKFIGFKLGEEFDEGNRSMGHHAPPHHIVSLRAEFKRADGKESYLSLGGWVRKSERETDAWRMAARSPVFWG